MPFLQDRYPDDDSHCRGCGRLSAHGLYVKREWMDGEARARKVLVEVQLVAGEVECARGRVTTVRLPPAMAARG